MCIVHWPGQVFFGSFSGALRQATVVRLPAASLFARFRVIVPAARLEETRMHVPALQHYRTGVKSNRTQHNRLLNSRHNRWWYFITFYEFSSNILAPRIFVLFTKSFRLLTNLMRIFQKANLMNWLTV